MDELFRLKIVSKRQVTLPPRLMSVLRLNEGDELQLEVVNGQIKSVRPLKLVPTDLFTPEILMKLDERERQIEAEGGRPFEVSSLEDPRQDKAELDV